MEKNPFVGLSVREQKRQRNIRWKYQQAINRYDPKGLKLALAEEALPLSSELIRHVEDKIVDIFRFSHYAANEIWRHSVQETYKKVRAWMDVLDACGLPISDGVIQRCYQAALEFERNRPGAREGFLLMQRVREDFPWPMPADALIEEDVRAAMGTNKHRRPSEWLSFGELDEKLLERMVFSHDDLTTMFVIAFRGLPSSVLNVNMRKMSERVDGAMVDDWLKDTRMLGDQEAYARMLAFVQKQTKERITDHLAAVQYGLDCFPPSRYIAMASKTADSLKGCGVPPTEAERAVRVAWADVFERMEKIQARTENQQHDPWKGQLDPLVTRAVAYGLLASESREDGELVEAFVKRYGMNNMPNAFRWFVWTSRAKSMDDLTDEQKKEIADGLGIKIEKFKNKGQLHVELKRMQEEIRSALLADRIPACFERAPIAAWEIFEAMKGATAWERNDDFQELIKSVRLWQEERPDEVKLPEGYERVRIEAKERLGRQGEIDEQIRRILHEDETLQDEMTRLYSMIGSFLTHSESRALPDFWRELLERWHRQFAVDWKCTEGLLGDMRSFLSDYMLEHYLHPSQEEHRTGHKPFDEKKLTVVRNAWRLEKPDENPVIIAHRRIKEMRRTYDESIDAKREKQKTLTFDLVPVRGLLRVYAGDVGDACYTSRHAPLARGRYPGITVFIYVAKPGTPQERWAGSVLVIETRTENGEPALLIRANNPRQNVIAGLDADVFVERVMEKMIELAKRRGIKYVVAPMDRAGQSSTNREEIADAYRLAYMAADKIALEDVPETNFNGYNNWDMNGDYPCGIVWEEEGL